MTEAARVAPGLPRGWLVADDAADWEARARTLGCVSVHCDDGFMTPGWAAAIRRAGFALGIYTVNDPARARLLRGWGVDCIFTDRPDALGRAAC